LRVLIVTSYFWPENFRINDLAVGLKERGHDVTVLTNLPNYPAGNYYPGYDLFKKRVEYCKGIKIIRIPQIPRGNGKALNLVLNYFSSALMLSLLGPLYCHAKFDLILVPQFSPATIGFPAILLKKLKSLPIVFWILDIWPESLSATGAVGNPKILGMVRRLIRFIYRRCDRILVSSRGFIQSVQATGGYSGQIDYFPNWVEPEYIVDDQQINGAVLPELPTGFRIMFAGNIGAAQDFETILLAAEELREFKDIQWLILGDGREAEWVKDQVRHRKLTENFHLLGRYPAEMMPSFFAQADVMLMTLKRAPIFSLTAPGKIQSYMAGGKPIVAGLDGEGSELVVNSGAGVACPAESPIELAKCVLELYRMPAEDRKKMGERGRLYCAEHFNRDKQFSKLEDIMREVVRGK
jgi:colanic acid biosynthesis glycosyl transferase WcaI